MTPEEFRKAIGNRIYGCDDCQLFCPWNKFATRTAEADFAPRHDLDTAELLDLFAWDEEMFLARMEGSAIRRIGHERWLRNIAVALGNAATTPAVVAALNLTFVKSASVKLTFPTNVRVAARDGVEPQQSVVWKWGDAIPAGYQS